MNTTKTIKTQWEEVYQIAQGSLVRPLTDPSVLFYRTSGGGPEGGYFVKLAAEDPNDLNCSSCEAVYEGKRQNMEPWILTHLPNTFLEFEPEDVMRGRTARCRLIKQIQEDSDDPILEFKDPSGNICLTMTLKEWNRSDDAGTEVKLIADCHGVSYVFRIDQEDLDRLKEDLNQRV